MIGKLFQKLYYKFNKQRFDRTCKQVLQTAPINTTPNASVVVVSLIYHNALDMTILALKSFLHVYPQVSLELLDDGSLTEQDKSTLSNHFIGVKIINISAVDVGTCPRGGCWERLSYIIQRSEHAYVIQVDTDTLTIGPLDDVYALQQQNIGFAVGETIWQERINLDYLRLYSASLKSTHIQNQAEEHLHGLNEQIGSYMRTCAAFAGFPKGKLNMSQLEALSAYYSEKLGKQKWNDWGSEQFASNAMLSMLSSSTILPWPKYQNYGFPEYKQNIEGTVSFVHFIGTNRFIDNTYQRLAKNVIRSL